MFATYIINRLPSALLDWKTTFEIFYGHSSSYDNFRCFGCLCYVTNTIPHKDKLDHRVIICIFLGFNVGQKVYKVCDLQSHKILVFRDIVFYENAYPYQPLLAIMPLPIVSPFDDQEFHTLLPDSRNTLLDSSTTHNDLDIANDHSFVNVMEPLPTLDQQIKRSIRTK